MKKKNISIAFLIVAAFLTFIISLFPQKSDVIVATEQVDRIDRMVVDFADLSIKNNKMHVVYNDEVDFVVPDYDLYLFKSEYKTSPSYYLADTLKDLVPEDVDYTSYVVCTIEIRANFDEWLKGNVIFDYYEINVFYKHVYYVLGGKISHDVYKLLTSSYVEVDYNNKELVDRLNESALYRDYVTNILEKQNKEANDDISSSKDSSNKANSIDITRTSNYPYGTLDLVDEDNSINCSNTRYDYLTNTDSFIDEYDDSAYINSSSTNFGYQTDNSIVNIIPKNLFFQVGKQLYIGKEYAFFVYNRGKIDQNFPTDYVIDVFVIDIENQLPSFDNGTYFGYVNLLPLFQRRFRAFTKEDRNNMWDGFDPNLIDIVLPFPLSSMPEYSITNTNFMHLLENEIELNANDYYYSAADDNGAFFISSRFSFNGIGLKRYNYVKLFDLINYGAGFINRYGIDKISTILTGLGLLIDLFSTEAIVDEYSSGPEQNNFVYAPNKTYQINEYGGLLKLINVIPYMETDKPVIFKCGNSNYAKSTYTINYDSYEVPTRVYNMIDFDVGQDDSYKVLMFGFGGYTYHLTDSYSCYPSSICSELPVNSMTDSMFYGSNDHLFYRIIPDITGEYCLETIGNADTVMKLYKDGIQLEIDNDSGVDSNSRINCNLIKDNVYYVEVFPSSNNNCEVFEMAFLYDVYNSSLVSLYNTYGFQITDNKKMFLYRLDVSSTRVYDILTLGSSLDTIIYLFDDSFNLIDYSDNYGNDINGLIHTMLHNTHTYYICVKSANDSNGTSSLTVRYG